MSFDKPILFLVFNRPLQAMIVFDTIRAQQPSRLYIAADGPRAHKSGEKELCEETRKAVLEAIDWPCDVRTLLRDENLGCGKAVSSAINWFFYQEEDGIILEDDCVPDPTFFSFCASMLDRFKDDDNIYHINGSNFQMEHTRGDGSYYMSRYAHIWGWASWRRAWEQYDFTMNKYADRSREGLNNMLRDELQRIYNKEVDTWDIQWFFSVWFNHGACITPNCSLVRNIGYGKDATHTHQTPPWFRKIRYGTLPAITHPSVLSCDTTADQFTADTLYNSSVLVKKLKKIVKTNPILSKLYQLLS
ncbi:glycosyltransferase family 2 protein [Chitinophaga sp.]|uniref:glycosyltransferase family 2 protein n=1 Tax=Chitinophaga sp. TaxID=1869181 RepID=UPI0031D332D3